MKSSLLNNEFSHWLGQNKRTGCSSIGEARPSDSDFPQGLPSCARDWIPHIGYNDTCVNRTVHPDSRPEPIVPFQVHAKMPAEIIPFALDTVLIPFFAKGNPIPSIVLNRPQYRRFPDRKYRKPWKSWHHNPLCNPALHPFRTGRWYPSMPSWKHTSSLSCIIAHSQNMVGYSHSEENSIGPSQRHGNRSPREHLGLSASNLRVTVAVRNIQSEHCW